MKLENETRHSVAFQKVAQLFLWHLSLQLYNCFTAPEGGER